MPDAYLQIDARRRYLAHLRQAPRTLRRGASSYAVWWSGPGDPAADQLLDAVLDADATPERVLKQSRINRTLRARLFECDVVIKRFDLPTLRHRLKYRLRASRARRAWAAARTLTDLDIATPTPLGFVERTVRRFPAESYAISGFLPQAVPARRWIKAHLHRRPDAFRDAFAGDLSLAFLALYRRRVYHGDTKTGNLLIVAPDRPEDRWFGWIDLECMQFGAAPTRRRVLRNLVQLNGSVGSKLSEADRLDFLARLAADFAWVRDPRIPEVIRRRTRQRLQREVRGLCGP